MKEFSVMMVRDWATRMHGSSSLNGTLSFMHFIMYENFIRKINNILST